MTEKKIVRPIPVEKFPKIVTNCLGFAIGCLKKVRRLTSPYDLDGNLPIDEAFISKVSELGYDTTNFRKINSIEDANPNEYVFMVIGFVWEEARQFDYDRMILLPKLVANFHIVRYEREKYGKRLCVDKAGWDLPPRHIKDEDWPEILDEFGEHYALIAYSFSSEEEE